jgi:hypothetical protein
MAGVSGEFGGDGFHRRGEVGGDGNQNLCRLSRAGRDGEK